MKTNKPATHINNKCYRWKYKGMIAKIVETFPFKRLRYVWSDKSFFKKRMIITFPKIDVCIVTDKSATLCPYTQDINSALKTMIYKLKTSYDLYGIYVYLTVVAFDGKEKILVDFQN